MNAAAGGAAGWYGKLACLGDFASRRLAGDEIARWDAWLQQVLAGSRTILGEAWLDAYLTSPVWHFAEWPTDGPPLPTFRIGVLMPSVDKVGRYFPLIVSAALPAMPARESDWHEALDWLARIEAAALDTLDTSRQAQQFDDALLAMPPPAPRASVPAAPLIDVLQGLPAPLQTLRVEGLDTLFVELGASALARSARGASLWWTRAETPSVFACQGLPDAARFADMLRACPAGAP